MNFDQEISSIQRVWSNADFQDISTNRVHVAINEACEKVDR